MGAGFHPHHFEEHCKATLQRVSDVAKTGNCWLRVAGHRVADSGSSVCTYHLPLAMPAPCSSIYMSKVALHLEQCPDVTAPVDDDARSHPDELAAQIEDSNNLRQTLLIFSRYKIF